MEWRGVHTIFVGLKVRDVLRDRVLLFLYGRRARRI